MSLEIDFMIVLSLNLKSLSLGLVPIVVHMIRYFVVVIRYLCQCHSLLQKKICLDEPK